MRTHAELVREGYEVVRQSPTAVALLFYGRLFNLEPSLRNLFKTDLRVQAKKLMDSLDLVIQSLDRMDEVRPLLRSMGRTHVTYGVLPEHYKMVTDALLWALGQALQPDFDAEGRGGWAAILQDVCREMLAGGAVE